MQVKLCGCTGGEKGGNERAQNYTFSYGEGKEDHWLGSGFLVHKGIISEVSRVELVIECYIEY